MELHGNTYKMKIDNDNNYTSKNVKVNRLQ